MSRGKLTLLLVGIAALAVGTFFGARKYRSELDRRAEERLLNETSFAHSVSVAAPDASVLTADGQRVKLLSTPGKVVFVNFWATWCPPCIQEMPTMLRLAVDMAATHPGQFEMVAVSEDDSWDPVGQYFNETFGGVPRSVRLVRDPDLSAARAYYCTARGYCPGIKFPETYVVDRSGKIVSMIVGPRNWSDPGARQWLEFLIAG